jgi:hypothetical protein
MSEKFSGETDRVEVGEDQELVVGVGPRHDLTPAQTSEQGLPGPDKDEEEDKEED